METKTLRLFTSEGKALTDLRPGNMNAYHVTYPRSYDLADSNWYREIAGYHFDEQIARFRDDKQPFEIVRVTIEEHAEVMMLLYAPGLAGIAWKDKLVWTYADGIHDAVERFFGANGKTIEYFAYQADYLTLAKGSSADGKTVSDI